MTDGQVADQPAIAEHASGAASTKKPFTDTIASEEAAMVNNWQHLFEHNKALRESRKSAIIKSLFFFVVALLISIGFTNNSVFQTFNKEFTDFLQLCHCDRIGCTNGGDFVLTTSRIIFVVGVLSSMVAQARVEAYFKQSSLSSYTIINFKLNKFVDDNIGWSSIFISVALCSMAFINYPVIHIGLSYTYIALILGIDCLYYCKTLDRDPRPQFFLKSPAIIIKEFSHDLIWKVDVVSIVPLTILITAAVFIYFFGAHWFGAQTPWDQMAEIFLSGVIGFHLFATWLLLEAIMYDWNQFLSNSASAFTKITTTSTIQENRLAAD